MSAKPTTPQAQTRQLAQAHPRVLVREAGVWAVLRWLVPLALIHGLVYLALVPPWQHYDEPTHFEYAHMIAEIGGVPSPTRPTTDMRWPIAESMGRFNFWRDGQAMRYVAPDVPFIGFDQRVHPPLYYMLAALPIRATLQQPVETQLYAARLLSVLLYALAVVAVWRLSVVIAPDSPTAQLVVPLAYAAVPPYAAIMTAVNNDVLVNFTGATLLLGCALLIRDGPRPFHLALAVLSLGVGVLAKRTAILGAPLVALALFWAVVRRPVRLRYGLSLIGLLAAAVLVGGLRVDTSGPSSTLGLRSWVNELDTAYLRMDLDRMIHSLTDWQLGAATYPHLFTVAFGSFWAAYGWGHVQIGRLWEWALVGLSALALAGLAFRWPWRSAELPAWRRRSIWLFLACAVIGVVALVLRLHPLPPYGDYTYIPRGRYLFVGLPAIIWLIAVGVMSLAPRGRAQAALIGVLGLLVALDSFGLIRLVQYYYGSPWPIVVLASQKPGLLGLPPLYPVLLALYLAALTVALRRLARAH